MDPAQLLEILRNTETGIGFNTLVLIYLTYLTRKRLSAAEEKITSHEIRISALEIHNQQQPSAQT